MNGRGRGEKFGLSFEILRGTSLGMFRTFLSILLFVFPTWVLAQAPGVAIFDQSKEGIVAEERAIGVQLWDLVEKGKVPSKLELTKMIEKPTPRKLELPEASDSELSAIEISELGQRRNYRIGWGYICTKCDHWHFILAGGYAVAKNGVIVTCSHVIDLERLPEQLKMAALVVIDSEGKVFPVTGVLANNKELDAAAVMIDAETVPYALTDQVSPGDAAFCFSRPLNQGNYFTIGIVNRFYWEQSPAGKDENSLSCLAHLRLNVDCRWAPGSSGSPVFDRFGNVIGHVSRINTMGKRTGDDESGGTGLISLHMASPARSVKAMLLNRE